MNLHEAKRTDSHKSKPLKQKVKERVKKPVLHDTTKASMKKKRVQDRERHIAK